MRNLTSPSIQTNRCWVGLTPDAPFSEGVQEHIRDEIGEVVFGRQVCGLEVTERYVLVIVELQSGDDIGTAAQAVARDVKSALPISTPFRDLALHKQCYAGTVGAAGDLKQARERLEETTLHLTRRECERGRPRSSGIRDAPD